MYYTFWWCIMNYHNHALRSNDHANAASQSTNLPLYTDAGKGRAAVNVPFTYCSDYACRLIQLTESPIFIPSRPTVRARARRSAWRRASPSPSPSRVQRMRVDASRSHVQMYMRMEHHMTSIKSMIFAFILLLSSYSHKHHS